MEEQERESVQLGMPSSCERMSVYAHRLYYSKTWSTFYAIMILANLTAIIALVAVHATGHPDETPGWLLFIEIMVNLLLILELGVRMIAQQQRFFRDACNIFDFFVAIICVGLFVVYIDSPAQDKDEALVGTIVLAVRYVVVTARMAHITWQAKNRSNQLDIGKQKHGILFVFQIIFFQSFTIIFSSSCFTFDTFTITDDIDFSLMEDGNNEIMPSAGRNVRSDSFGDDF